MTNHSGKLGKATINGTEIPITNWNVRSSVPMAKFVHSQSGGYIIGEPAAGKTAQVTITVARDFDANAFDAPTGIVIGASLTLVKLYEYDTSGPFWNFPTLLVSDVSEGVQIEGTNMVAFQVTGLASGTFQYPGNITA